MKNLFFSLVTLATLVLLLPSCRNSSGFNRMRGNIWSTNYNISYRGPEALEDSVNLIFSEVENSLSFFKENSLVNQVNTQLKTKVDKHFASVYYTARKIYLLSKQDYDPTVKPLVEAWGFGKDRIPNSDTIHIDSLRRFVGLNLTHLANDTLFKKDIRTAFDFSSVAKGYACDLIAEMFLRNNVVDFIIEVGGEIVTSGQSDKNRPWRVAVEIPDFKNPKPDMESYLPLEISGGAIASSGNYRNFQQLNGRVYGHTISPALGRPVESDVLSASVLADKCAEADALATACMVIGSRRARKMLSACGCSAILVTNDSIIRVNWPE